MGGAPLHADKQAAWGRDTLLRIGVSSSTPFVIHLSAISRPVACSIAAYTRERRPAPSSLPSLKSC